MIQILLLVVFLAAALQASAQNTQFHFNVGPRYQLGLNAFDRAFADFDSDGIMDVVAVNGGQDNPNPTITILFGNEFGEFGDRIVLPTFAIGRAVSTGDLNADGLPDVVLASFYHNALVVVHNQGARQFSEAVITIPPDPTGWGGEFFGVGVADFDGDGHNDVVALQDQSDQRLRFFHANSNGSLTNFATLDQNSGGTSYEAKMAIGDINGDTRPDVVLAGGGPFGVRGFRFVFGQAPGIPLEFTHGFTGVDRAVGIEIVDLDGDSDNELVVAFYDPTTPTRHSLQVFENDGTAVFSPQPKMFLEYPFPPEDLTVADFDGDDKLDIAALIGSNSDAGVMVLIKYGMEGLDFEGDKYYASSSSTSIYSIDIDFDGNIDIITASSFGLQTAYDAYSGISTSTLGVISNLGSRRFEAPVTMTWGPEIIDYGDFNRDGWVDLASAWKTNAFDPSGVDLLHNNSGEGFLLPEWRQVSPRGLKGMRTGDFDGDGKRDAVTSHDGNGFRGVVLYLGNGTGRLDLPKEFAFSDGVYEVTVGDFDGNGCDDVFVVDRQKKGYVLLGNPSGILTMAPGSPITFSGVEPVAAQVGDFNNDLMPDLIISRNEQLYLYLGDGMGAFSHFPTSIPSLKNVFPGDFNNDGNLDLAGLAPPTGPLPPWRTDELLTGVMGDGKGGFIMGSQVAIPNFSHSTVQSLVTADFDLDGFDDVALIMRENTFGNLIIVSSDGETGWREPVFLAVGPARTMLVAHDFDQDGDIDLAFRGDNGRGIVYNTLIGRIVSSLFDFDGDGRTDISVFRPSVGEWWWQRSSDGQVPAVQFGLSTDVIAPADFTGDGKTDTAFWRPSTGEWFILRSENFSFYSFPFGGTGDIPVPADYDGDGKADAAVFRPSSGTWFIFRSSDSQVSIVGFGVSGDQPVPADYDGDGKADVGIYRPNGASGGEWWIQRSTAGLLAVQFGNSTDRIVPGDYTGDGKTDVAFWRPASGEWFILRSEDLSFYSFPFGGSGDIPTQGDYDGDGKADAAVFRPSAATWYIQGSMSGTMIHGFGTSTDQPVPSAFVR